MKGNASLTIQESNPEESYYLCYSDQKTLVTTEVFENVVYLKHIVKKDEFLIRIYQNLGYPNFATKYKEDYKLKVNGPDGPLGEKNIRRHGDPSYILPGDTYFIHLEKVQISEKKVIEKVKPIKWWAEKRATDLIKELNELEKEVKDYKQSYEDYKAKQHSMSVFDIYLPGTSLRTLVGEIAGGIDYLASNGHEVTAFALLLVAPIAIVPLTIPAVAADQILSIEQVAEDVLKIGPEGRYLSKSEAEEVLKKIDTITHKISSIREQIQQVKHL